MINGGNRTAYVFDMMPWKLVFCPYPLRPVELGRVRTSAGCEAGGTPIEIVSLPAAPEPGRIPEGVDHLHIVTKGSGERDAREDAKWRALVMGTARCPHGHLQGDVCRKCGHENGLKAPDVSGTQIGRTYRGEPIIIPARDGMKDIRNWVQKDD